MDSMRRGEANTSHHPNKVVNSLATDSNNKTTNIRGSSLNNNRNFNNQSASHPSSEQLKDSNFEYDDNEWDVGIGDLIIDLDADIEKSARHDPSADLIATNSSENPLSGGGGGTATNQTAFELKKSLAAGTKPVSTNRQVAHSAQRQQQQASGLKQTASILVGGHPKPQTSIGSSTAKESQSPTLIRHLNSSNKPPLSGGKSSSFVTPTKQQQQTTPPTEQKTESDKLAAMSSNASKTGSSSATKLAVDHQATLDKGLKMKIKRTKPGTKTSEAKHEIVKAEQNGTNVGVDDNSGSGGGSNTTTTNSNLSGGSKSKHSQIVTALPVVVPSPVATPPSSQATNKRGNSGHRRDKVSLN
jgi:hypothetical protein